MTNLSQTLGQKFYTEENVIIHVRPCLDLGMVTRELGLEESDIRTNFGPYTMFIAHEIACDIIINGFPTGLNQKVNECFPLMLEAHEVLLTIPGNDDDPEITIAETLTASEFPWSDCCKFGKHEAGEA